MAPLASFFIWTTEHGLGKGSQAETNVCVREDTYKKNIVCGLPPSKSLFIFIFIRFVSSFFLWWKKGIFSLRFRDIDLQTRKNVCVYPKPCSNFQCVDAWYVYPTYSGFILFFLLYCRRCLLLEKEKSSRDFIQAIFSLYISRGRKQDYNK